MGVAAGFVTAFVVPSEGSTDDMRTALNRVYYVTAAICGALLIAAIINFPSKPPTTPSASSMKIKLGIKDGLKSLIVHRRFWIVVICMTIPTGIFSAWLLVLDINLDDLGFDQGNAAWIGLGSVCAGCFAGISSGRIADAFPGKLKQIIICLYGLATLSFFWFSLTCQKILPFSLTVVYVSCIIGGFCIYGAYPLFFELCVETTFPIAEGATAGFLVLTQGVVQALFLAVPVDQLGTSWMNWTLAFSIPLFGIILYLFKEDYGRLRHDTGSLAVTTEVN